MTHENDVRKIEKWLIQTLLGELDTPGFLAVFSEMCQQIDTSLFPVFRCHITMHTLHTFFDHNDYTWYRDGTINENSLPRSSDETRDSWAQSPLFPMLEKLQPELRLDLKDPTIIEKYPLFSALSNQGVTDYVAFLRPFGPEEKVAQQKDGIMLSWITDNQEGFTADHIEILRRLTAVFSGIARLYKREQTLDNMLTAYLGKTPTKRILMGATQRGDGATTTAVIWMCDLRNSTELAFSRGESAYLSLLNKFLEYMAKAVMQNDGEILKFMGDGFLAIFPAGTEQQAKLASKNAVKSAIEAQAGFDNKFRSDNLAGFGIGIHLGEVMFGNIGAPERLDFSVIGSAVNIASRLQDLTKTLPSPILMSPEIASRIDQPVDCFPKQTIRGSNLLLDVYAPHDV